MRTDLGNRIQEARREAGYSNPESFAVALGVSSATVNRYEQGRIAPSIARLSRIAQLTSRPLSYFLEEVAA